MPSGVFASGVLALEQLQRSRLGLRPLGHSLRKNGGVSAASWTYRTSVTALHVPPGIREAEVHCLRGLWICLCELPLIKTKVCDS